MMPKKMIESNGDKQYLLHLITDSESEGLDLNDRGFEVSGQVTILSSENYLKKRSQILTQYDEIPLVQESQDCVNLRSKTRYEEIDEYTDVYPLLEFRKVLLTILSSVSELCTIINSSIWFEYFIILVIIFNILVLSLENPDDPSLVYSAVDEVFLIIYTVEASIKIFALGFILNPHSYIRENWNKLDLAIVITGWLSYLSYNSVNFSSIRTLRILRPLRSISSISGLRVIFVALIKSVIPLFASLVVLFFFLLIFAIAGVQLWSGSFRYQCLDLSTGKASGTVCGNYECSMGQSCAYTLDNPNYGVTNFDNIFYALLNVFQCITLEGWTNIMITAQKSFGDYIILYFLPLVFIGAFLLLSITLAVIKNSFSKAIKEVEAGGEKPKNKKIKKFKARIQDFSPEQSFVDDSKEGEKKNEATDQITYKSMSLRNRGMNFDLQVNLKHQVHFEVEDEKYEESISLMSDLDKFKSSPGQDMPTKANHESKEEEFNEKISLRPSLNLPKSQSFKTLDENIGQMFLPQSFFLFKGLTDKYNLTGEINEFKFIISDYEIPKTSYQDVKPEHVQIQPVFSLNKFIYSENLSDEYEDLNQCRSELIIKKHNLKRLKIFSKFSRKSNNKFAFSQFFLNSKTVIESILMRDLMSQCTLAVWSGHDVDELKDHEGIKSVVNLIQFQSNFTFYWNHFIFNLGQMTRSRVFHFLMIFCVILNTIVLSIDHYGISNELSNTLSIINTCFTYIFLVEMMVKLLAKGIRNYFKDYMNYFDAVVVIVSIIELIFVSGEKSTLSAFRIIRVFRIFRVVRVARLFRYLQSMTLIMKVISGSLSKFIYIALLLLLFTVIYTLLGMQVFRGNFNFPEGKPRSNFDSFHNSFISTFQVLSIENWQSILYFAIRSKAGASGAILLISWIILGNFILLNLFLAILLEGFNSKYEDYEVIVNQQPERRASIMKRTLFGNLEGRIRKKQEAKKQMMQEMNFESEDSGEDDDLMRQATVKRSSYENIICDRSYFIFSKESKLRMMCYDVINNKAFDYFVLFIITCSTVKVAVDTYLIEESSTSTLVRAMIYLDIIFTVLFSIEFMLKSVALGFVEGSTSYIRDTWNTFDFLIVIFSILDLSLVDINLSVIKSVRILRTLRPLRFISHNISMKIVVVALFDSLIAIFNVIVVLLIVWLIFAILGVSLLGGKLYNCSNSDIQTQAECSAFGFNWEVIEPNYDNVINAISTLFILSSEEGWPDIMYQAIDSRGVGLAPKRDSNPYLAYYFVVFILIGSFFFLNFFIGVVFDKFNWAKRNEMSTAALVLTKEQALWIEIQKLLPRVKPSSEVETEKSRLRRLCTRIYKSRSFELFISFIIAVNIIQMAMIYNEAPSDYISVLENVNLSITCVFIIEAIIKIIGNGPKGYFSNNWNKFDFFVVSTSIIDIILSFFVGTSTILLRLGPQMFRMLRILRISKILRIFKALKTLETLVTIFGYSLPAILNVLSLLTLIFFIYSVLGVNLFHSVSSGKIISEYTNFHNFGKAMITLFRISTGEDWYLIMYDCKNAINLTVSGIFFMSFITITSFVMLNFFIMVIIQTYDDFEKNPFHIFKKFTHDIKNIKKIWSRFADKQMIYRIHFRKLIEMMKELSSDFGDFSQLSYDQMIKKLSAIQLEIDVFGFVYYNDFLFAIMKFKYRKKVKGKENALNKKIIQKEEIETQRKLAKRRSVLQQKFYSEGELSDVKNNKKINFFFDILNVKSVFRGWKKWAKQRKAQKKLLGGTPDDSEVSEEYQL